MAHKIYIGLILAMGAFFYWLGTVMKADTERLSGEILLLRTEIIAEIKKLSHTNLGNN